MAGSYGVGASLGSLGLAGMGMQQQKEATDMLGKAADEEQRRNIANKQAEQQRKTTNMTTGATTGAMIGTQIMPGWGTVIGGAIGAIAGNFM